MYMYITEKDTIGHYYVTNVLNMNKLVRLSTYMHMNLLTRITLVHTYRKLLSIVRTRISSNSRRAYY